MSKKPKFMHQTNELGDWFAARGRRLKQLKQAGIDDQVLKDQYKEIQQFQKELNVSCRHFKWGKTYESAFTEAFKKAVELQNKTSKQALKYARSIAEQAVVDKFSDEVTTTRAVRNAMNKLQKQ